MIDIYIAASSRAFRKQKRIMCYLLETNHRDEIFTKHDFMLCEGTLNECELKALEAAVNRLKAPMDVCIHSDDDYILVTMQHFNEIREEMFLKKDGTSLSHADLLKGISVKIVSAYAGTKHHAYENWMREEMAKIPPDSINGLSAANKE